VSSLHRIEVERNADGEVESVRFICDGGADATCHNYPDCGCEQWTREVHGQRFGQVIGYERGHLLYADRDIDPQPGHEPIQQAHCWMEPWFNETTDTWSDFIDLYDGPINTDDPAIYGEHADWLVSGPVTATFEGDYMTWEYEARAVQP
jgi:hypothetical protein